MNKLTDVNENGEANWETIIGIIGMILLIMLCGIPSLLIILNGISN